MSRLAGELSVGHGTGPASAIAPTALVPSVHTARVARIGVRHGSAAEIARMLNRGAVALSDRGYTTVHQTSSDDVVEVVLAHNAPWHQLILSAAVAPPEPDDLSDPLFSGLDRYDVTAHVTEGAPAVEHEWFMGAVASLRAACAPFTVDELDTVSSLNPLLDQLVAGYREAGTNLSDVTLVLREHMLLEKFNLLAGLRRLGLRPEKCHVIRKRDNTRYWRRICAELSRQGFAVHLDLGHEELATFVDLVLREVDAVQRPGPVLVVDDGGDLLIPLLAPARADAGRVFAVETTTKGIRVLKDRGLDSRVLDLASCAAKKAQSRQIAVSCVQRFRELLQHEPVEGQWCHVVGFGQLGGYVAGLLTAIGMRVTVSDVAPSARRAARSAGYQTYRTAAEGLESRGHRYLFGCSGSPAVDLDEVALMTDRPVLCSLSSQDLAPLLATLHPAGLTTRHGWGLTCTVGRQYVTILGNGDAVNLFLAEGVPEPDFDPFTSMMLVTVVEQANAARSTGTLLSPECINELAAGIGRCRV